jgi:hypothetical protein
MHKNRLSQLVAVIVIVMAVISSGVAMRSASAAGSVDPLKAFASGTVSLTSETTFELVGTVKANRIGNMSGYQADGYFTGPNTDALTETLTAANGDTLIMLCNQVLAEIGPGVFRGTDTWTVLGGTGRFSNATGSGTGETTVDLNTGTFTKSMTGVITIPDED